MTPALLAGLGAGAGLLLVFRGLFPPAPPLAKAMAGLDGDGAGGPGGPGGSAGLARARRVAGVPSERRTRDLRVTGSTPERHAAAKVTSAAALACFPFAASLVATAGGVHVAPSLAVLSALAGGCLGWVVPDMTLRSAARDRRRELRDALSAYLELAVTVIAGGGGVETALHDAADAGSGWAFDELRQALEVSRLAGEAPWEGFRRLGGDLGSEALVEVAAGATLAGEHGARIRASLTARARSMRDHRLAEVEAEAMSATERMAVPVVLMLFAFVMFVGYPAVQRVLVGL